MNHERHIGIFDASDLSVALIGAGGIGAMTAVALAKMGVESIIVYDDDEVSEVNLPTQFHKLADLGRKKVHALADAIAEYSDDTTVFPDERRIEADGMLYGNVVISAVDSIAARKSIWQAVKNGSCQWYLDARMAAEEFHLYTVDFSKPVEWYDNIISREDDSSIPEISCTSKATFYTACVAAGQLGSALRKIATGVTPARYLIHNIFADRLTVIQG